MIHLRWYLYWLPWRICLTVLVFCYRHKDNSLARKLRYLAEDYDTRPGESGPA